MNYPEELVAPMREELSAVGFTHLMSPIDVENVLGQKEGSVLLVINSVCGCAAGTCRPGVTMAIKNTSKKPSQLVTVFAGMEKDAVEKARSYTLPYPPSSPSIALFKNGELVHFVERLNIEGRTAEMISANLQDAFEKYC